MRYSTGTITNGICCKPGKKYSYSEFTMKGRWLEKEGFFVGDRVRVIADRGTIKIRKIKGYGIFN